ncbi:MAG TPA: hypothetical protein VII33_08360 [Nakamurella sp.]
MASSTVLFLTRLNEATISSVTRRSARALIACTVEISSSTSVSVISHCRSTSKAASRTHRTSGAASRKWLGDNTAARTRQPVTTSVSRPTGGR